MANHFLQVRKCMFDCSISWDTSTQTMMFKFYALATVSYSPQESNQSGKCTFVHM